MLSHVFGAVDKTSSLVFSAHGKIGNFIINCSKRTRKHGKSVNLPGSGLRLALVGGSQFFTISVNVYSFRTTKVNKKKYTGNINARSERTISSATAEIARDAIQSHSRLSVVVNRCASAMMFVRLSVCLSV